MTGAGARALAPGVPQDRQCQAPLDELYAAHLRHRQICAALAAGVAAPWEIPALVTELADGLLRLDAAERLLFDLLRRRAEPDDDVARVLGILAADHEADRALLVTLGGATTEHILRFAAHKLRTIALENAVVLPFARLRLTCADLRRLAASLGAPHLRRTAKRHPDQISGKHRQ